MKRILPLLFAILLFAIYPVQALACTSFAVYRKSVLYGMNFDYSDVPVRYVITQSGDTAVFHVDFETYGHYVPIAGMNGNGMFLAVQMLYPEELGTIEANSNKAELHTFAQQALFHMKSMEEVKKQLDEQQLVNTFLTLHCMLADRNGEALVLEPGKEQSRITQTPGDYLVMTNFSNADAFNPDTQEMENVDCERYLAAESYIVQSGDAFTIEDGLEALKRSMQSGGSFPTQNSMVCDPVNGDIYIVVQRDFEKVWKVSLAQKTIESYSGFAQPIKRNLDEQGITAQELIALANTPQTEQLDPAQAPEKAVDQPAALPSNLPARQGVLGPLAIAGICLVGLCIIGAVWLLRHKRR